MYKVFVNNAPISLSTEKETQPGVISLSIKDVDLIELIKILLEDQTKRYHLYHKKEDRLFQHLKKKLPVVTAGGGKVYNDQNEILFIHRNGKWDLPKGKTEKKESIEVSALREVEEETGVQGLEIIRFLQKTYHIFKRNGEFRLKETYWFEMKTSYAGKLYPQLNEGIEKAKWKDYQKAKKALGNSYENIKLLFSKDYIETEI